MLALESTRTAQEMAQRFGAEAEGLQWSKVGSEGKKADDSEEEEGEKGAGAAGTG